MFSLLNITINNLKTSEFRIKLWTKAFVLQAQMIYTLYTEQEMCWVIGFKALNVEIIFKHNKSWLYFKITDTASTAVKTFKSFSTVC